MCWVRLVASINGRGETDRALTELSLDEWHGWLDANLTAHFSTARTFLPVMTHGGSYTFMGGGAAHKSIPRYGAVCIPAAAQLMLVRVRAEENCGSGVRINEVVLNSLIVTRERPASKQKTQLTAEEVGRYIAWLASEEASMVSGSIIGLYAHPDLDAA